MGKDELLAELSEARKWIGLVNGGSDPDLPPEEVMTRWEMAIAEARTRLAGARVSEERAGFATCRRCETSLYRVAVDDAGDIGAIECAGCGVSSTPPATTQPVRRWSNPDVVRGNGS